MKLGKSTADGGQPIWLSETKTSVFDLYQYFVRTSDADVERFLRLFTFLRLDEIESVMAVHNQQPETRHAQKVLAQHVITFVHGEKALENATKTSSFVYENDFPEVQRKLQEDLDGAIQLIPHIHIEDWKLKSMDILSIGIELKIGKSKSKTSQMSFFFFYKIYL